MLNFNKQNIIVTGGTRGIGKAIVEAFLRRGANVIATYSSNISAAEELKASNEEFKNQLDLQKFCVEREKDVVNFFEYIEEKYNNIDVLINNSGIRKDSIVASMPFNEWQDVLNINLNGTFLMSKAIIPIFMKKRYGRIVNISSIGAELGISGQANYASSKAGQIAFSKVLSKEVAKKGITINNICPGFINTDLLKDLPQELIKEYKKQVPMKRFGTTEDVANAALFLASKESSYITGSTLNITGGL